MMCFPPWTWTGSNRRPPVCHTGALPTALQAQTSGAAESNRVSSDSKSDGLPSPPRQVPPGHPTRRGGNARRCMPSTVQFSMSWSAGHAGAVRMGGRNRTRNIRFWRPALFRIELHP